MRMLKLKSLQDPKTVIVEYMPGNKNEKLRKTSRDMPPLIASSSQLHVLRILKTSNDDGRYRFGISRILEVSKCGA
jgi:hypothetical protein